MKWCQERIVSVKTFLCAIMRFHFSYVYCMSTVNEDLDLCRFKCVFAYKVAPNFILDLLKNYYRYMSPVKREKNMFPHMHKQSRNNKCTAW